MSLLPSCSGSGRGAGSMLHTQRPWQTRTRDPPPVTKHESFATVYLPQIGYFRPSSIHSVISPSPLNQSRIQWMLILRRHLTQFRNSCTCLVWRWSSLALMYGNFELADGSVMTHEISHCTAQSPILQNFLETSARMPDRPDTPKSSIFEPLA